MGKTPVITKEQLLIFEELAKVPFIKDNFYFTGGTALSECYLHHRYSDDLDFFTDKTFDTQTTFSIMESIARKHNLKVNARFVEVTHKFQLIFPKKNTLKVDFGVYPYKKVDKEKIWQGLQLDSLKDIATNKMITISQRTDIKDFVDLYFLLQKKFTIWDLVYSSELKFRMKQDILLLAADLLKVEDFTFLPRMIIDCKIDDVKLFYHNLAKRLGCKVTK